MPIRFSECYQNLEEVRKIVFSSKGPASVLAIVNGGTKELVTKELCKQIPEIFRKDGKTKIFAHEEPVRRGQLLGLLDAIRYYKQKGNTFDINRVALGIMLPGNGTRLSPITQKLRGIKPFFPMPIRPDQNSQWCTAASASLYTWTHVTYHLERMGFRGIAWKWGDEPQISASLLAEYQLDLSQTDAVRFGSKVEVTPSLAENKEWLLCDPETHSLQLQIRRRPYQDLKKRFGVTKEPFFAHVNLGSPAFSYPFLEEAEKVFHNVSDWLDVDGYLFEALTQSKEDWDAEIPNDTGLQALLEHCPDFYSLVQALKQNLQTRLGRSLCIHVLDFGTDFYWGDIGQLSKARDVFLTLLQTDQEGEFARILAAIETISPDRFGNRVVGNSQIPNDGSVQNSVVIDSIIEKSSKITSAVIIQSQLKEALIEPASVVFGSVVDSLHMKQKSFSFSSNTKHLEIAEYFVHTSIPVDPDCLEKGIEDWWMDSRKNPGDPRYYDAPCFQNKTSFAEKTKLIHQYSKTLGGIKF